MSSEKLDIKQNKKISELETKSDKLGTTLGEFEGNLVSSEKLVIEQNKKIQELETKQNAEHNKTVTLEMSDGGKHK